MKFLIKNLRNEGMIVLKNSVMKQLDLKIGDIVDVEICKDSEAMSILEAKVSDEKMSNLNSNGGKNVISKSRSNSLETDQVG